MKKLVTKKAFSSKSYKKKNPSRAKAINKAVKQGVKQYGATFRRLAST